ncbi:MAG TPA: 30S ribosomal protein S16 [Candidatus Peribacterales bacterium]|nr:30S ribosomal protein S16 [Candidatus Peribacterales bacterium]
MLVIRFQRTGRKNIPTFRLVVAEKRAAVKGGKVQEFLGQYLPARNPHVFTYEKDRVKHWIQMGAEPSDTVARLLKKDGMQGIDHFIKTYAKQKKKGEEPVAAAPKAPEAPKEVEKESSDEGEKKE